jgi:DNA topoisomerase-2
MKKIEDKYKVLSHIDHILLRPQTYLGSNKPHTSIKWVCVDEKMLKKEITYTPSFLKIFDEIITNCCDENKRNPDTLNIIKVNVDKDNGIISIYDNGGIPILLHKEHNKYVPEVIFGTLMSGSNYDDNDERTGAGVNGYGSKLTNVFSKEFVVSSCDGKNSFYQVFSNNMRDRNEPKIKKNKTNHTEIKYKPDFEKFGLDDINEEHYLLIYKRVIDIAGCNPSIKVFFNNIEIKIKSFEDYVKYYETEYYIESNQDKSWNIAISHSNEGFQQVSFVNTTETYDGGTHVDYILNQILTQLREFFQKKHKVDVKPSELKNHIAIYLDVTVVNPMFSSQTKEKLITEVKDFGHIHQISEKLIKWILKSEIVNSILDWIQRKKEADENKLTRELNKNISKIKVDKLIDAKGKTRNLCSLAIFEGDCLSEDTFIRILRDGEFFDIHIKDTKVGDLVITHNNSFSDIYAISKKIKEKATIKLKGLDDIICSHEHKWFVYDYIKNQFYFEETKNLKKDKHKLVKNYLAFTDDLHRINKIDNNIIDIFIDTIEANPEHKFAVYDNSDNKFKMIETKNLNKDIHFLVNTFKL